MATYNVHALRQISPKGIRGGGGGRGMTRGLDKFWVDKVTVDVDALNADLETDIAAGDIITFKEVKRDQILLQGELTVHDPATAGTLDLGHSGDRDAFIDGANITSHGNQFMVANNADPILVTVPATGTKTIDLEFKTGASAGAVFTIWWAWVDVDLDEKIYGAS